MAELAATLSAPPVGKPRSPGGNGRLNAWMLRWATSDPSFRTQLFRFVDVLPSIDGSEEISRHLREYLCGPQTPRLVSRGLRLSSRVAFGKSMEAAIARRSVSEMASQFIMAEQAGGAAGKLERMWRRGRAFTVDVLGEKTVTEDEADRYATRVDQLLRQLSAASREWPSNPLLEHDPLGTVARINLSIKPTALTPLYSPLTLETGLAQAAQRLRPLLRTAMQAGAFVNLDMEHYEVKGLTQQLFRSLLSEQELESLDAGIVVQAYLKDSYADLSDLVSLSASRSRPLTVRLVKGAYWDAETVHAKAAGWPVPVYEKQHETDANYERCAKLLLDHHGEVRAAFGSHNARSLAHVMSYAAALGLPPEAVEVQMLYGMALPLQQAVAGTGVRLRLYTPVGQLVPGMSYLVRRLLENTSNESLVAVESGRAHRRGSTGRPRRREVGPRLPGSPLETGGERPVPGSVVDVPPAGPGPPSPFRPEPLSEWHRREVREAFATAVDVAGRRDVLDVPAVIGDARFMTARTIESVDPGRPARVVGRSARCGESEAGAAVEAAAERWRSWAATPAGDRARVLVSAAEWMRRRRRELAALEVHEAGKPWGEADADVCEAIDYCEYYARQMMRLAQGGTVQSPPGESNSLTYRARGVAAVISPWNFPLAIPAGMVTAALVAGNTVVLKPAEQTPAVAGALVDALVESGLPPGVLSFVPGDGETAGAALVRHPQVALVAFTGSKKVGLEIIREAAVHRDGQRQVKRVIAEMGGKNALVVDADADLDQAIPAAIQSAFGHSGQKCSACSRLIVVGRRYDEVLTRLVGAAEQLQVGHASRMGTQMGPLIDHEAAERVLEYLELAPREGRLLLDGRLGRRPGAADGAVALGPSIVADVLPGSRLATEEIFGPVLSVTRAASIEQAVEMANDTDYALTAGIMSRSPAHIALAVEQLRAGNVYVNRTITGAVVGRQPFGGYGLSGVGSKAGGPDYLLQFLDPRTVSENTMRQGFAPQDTVRPMGPGPGNQAPAGDRRRHDPGRERAGRTGTGSLRRLGRFDRGRGN